jgi:hypothetical protein
LEAIFLENGKFTEDELFDIPPITSADDFFAFARKVYDVIESENLTAGGKKIITMPSFSGSDMDTWELLGIFFSCLLGAPGNVNTLFSYWDQEAQNVQSMIMQPFFKELMQKWSALIAEGKLTSTYGSDVPRATLQNEMNSGRFALAYGNGMLPSGYYAQINGKKVNFRRVYMKIPCAENFAHLEGVNPSAEVALLFKDTVQEGDIPQILQFFDYQQSELGEKVISWGPRDAGLFEVTETGKRKFKDAELEDNMVYSRASAGAKVKRYNLSNGAIGSLQPVFPFIYFNRGRFHPAVNYDKEVGDLSLLRISYTSYAVVPRELAKVSRIVSMHRIDDVDIPGIAAQWAKRPAIEDALKQVLASPANGFEGRYKLLLTALQLNGWTKNYFEKTIDAWFKTVNADYMSGLSAWTDNLA